MTYRHLYLFAALWLGWLAYWWVSSWQVKPSLRRESLPSRLVHITPLCLAAFLLCTPRAPLPILRERWLPPSAWAYWIGATLTAAGLLFSVWARWLLGDNWSGRVTVKEGHALITRGAYAIVRHPIYSGLLLALLGTATARGDGSGVAAVALTLLAFLRKLRLEERWMQDQFGEAYRAYRRRVAALVPLLF